MSDHASACRRRLAVVGAPRAIESLDQFLNTHRGQAPLTEVPVNTVPSLEELRDIASDADAVLAIGPRRRSPRTSVPGPVITVSSGRIVPMAWLPDTGPSDLRRFAATASKLRNRGDGPGSCTVAVLAQRSKRYRSLCDRIIRHLQSSEDPPRVCRWTADELIRDDLVEGLGLGLGAAIYVGHGRPIGWVGYRGVRARHLADAPEPIGVVMSLTCLTASRRRTGMSFSEALPLKGAAAASFGAVRSTDHIENSRWALRLARKVVEQRRSSVAELVVAAYTETPTSLGYRLLGDPFAPLADAPGLAVRIQQFRDRTAPPCEQID